MRANKANKANKKYLKDMVFCCYHYSDLVWEKNVIVIEKKVFKFEITRAMKGGFTSEGSLNFCPIIKKNVYPHLFHFSLISIIVF